MLKLKSMSFAFFLLGISMPTLVQAQSAAQIETDILEKVLPHYPDFRIVKTPENFPERYNASVEIPVRSGDPDVPIALVTLHDGNTGEPLESCYSPCSLFKAPNRPVFIYPYKAGFHTFPDGIELDPMEMREVYANWNNVYEFRLGTNYPKVRRHQKKCWREFQNKERVDGDAMPCFRYPPNMPAVALNASGSCQMEFDVSPRGRVVNARATKCSNPVFEGPSLFAVRQWVYYPKVERGMAVTRPSVKTKMEFRIRGFDGRMLDESGNSIDE